MCGDQQHNNYPNGLLVPLFVFNFCSICVSSDGKIWLKWYIPKEYDQFKGQKITWFNCFRKYNLCRKNLKRVHLTCLRCKLRKVVTGELPILQQVKLHILPLQLEYDAVHMVLLKKLLSIVEALT
jgi:hypothetical protein